MNRIISAFMHRFVVLLMFAALPVHATVEAPDHIYYGAVTLFGQPAANGTVVEARTYPAGELLQRYVVGSRSHLGGQYALGIPMDQVDPRREGRARPGDPVRLFVDGQFAYEVPGGVGAVGATTKVDLDPQNAGTGPAIRVEDAQVYEGDEGQSQAILDVSMNVIASPARPVTVFWETRNDTAVGGAACGPGVDFIHRANGALVIPAGALTASISVSICGDTVVEPDESFTVVLLSTADDFGVFERSTATVTILDDDNVPTLRVGNVRVAEPPNGSNTARFLATLSRSHQNPVSFTWATQNGTAQAGQDYLAAGGTVTIPAGETSSYLDVEILADGIVEPDETFRLFFSNPVSLGLPQTYAYGTIVDPAHDPALQETDAAVDGEDGVTGLASPQAVVLSPDGLHAYAAGSASNAVVHFSRDPGTGALGFLTAYKTSSEGFADARLQSPRDLAISNDGRFIYVAAYGSDAVTMLERDVDTGVLSFGQSLVHQQPQGSVQVQGLDDVVRLALSPDGAQLYALGRTSNSVATFQRDAETGMLNYSAVLASNAPGLSKLIQPSGIAVAPDGAQVYVTARGANALVVFNRQDSSTGDPGKLSVNSVLENGVGTTPSGLAGAFGIAMSPDGRQVYVAVEGENGVALLDRATDGTLSLREVLRHDRESSLHGLLGAREVEVAPNGKEVFVTASDSEHPDQTSSLTVFRRDTGNGPEAGKLSVHRTIFNGDNGLHHLSVPGAMAASGDDRYLYVTSSGDNGAVVVYRRLSADVLFSDGFEQVQAD